MVRFSMRAALTLLSTTAASLPAFAQEELVFSYQPGNAMPYADLKKGKLEGGIIKDFGEAMGQELKTKIRFESISRKRNDEALIKGEVHALCIYNPHWTEKRDLMEWSLPIFKEENWFVSVSKSKLKIKDFTDLKTKRIGAIMGYYYGPQLTELFKEKQAERMDVNRLEQNFEKLKAGRIDFIVDSNILIQDWVRRTDSKEIVKQPLLESQHDIHCALSKNSPVPTAKFNEALERLKANGRIEEILKKYRPNTPIAEAL